MKRLLILVLLFAFNTSLLLADNDPVETSATLQSATLLRVGAELTHTAKVKLASGTNEVVVDGLSAIIDANSLRLSCTGGVTVLSSVFSTDYLKTEVNEPKVKRLKDSIQLCEKELAQIEAAMNTNKELQSLLQANKSIGGQQNGLNVAELVKMMDYYKQKSTELQNEKYSYDERSKKLKETASRLRMQLDQEQVKNNKTSGALTLKLASPMAGTQDLTISYYTMAASWTPFYDIQAFDSDKPIKMACKANIAQTTGLDWKKVKLTLSTATPSNGKVAPLFETWFLQYVSPYASNVKMKQNAAMQNSYYASPVLEEAVVTGYGVAKKEETVVIRGSNSISANTQPLYVVDGQIMSVEEAGQIDPGFIKNVTVLKDASATAIYGSRAANGVILIELKDANSYVTESEKQLDVTYNIDQAYDLQGNGNEQVVTLRTIDVPATYEYYSAPKLDKSVFLLAKLTDWEKLNLLAGEANITHDGTYVGKSYINPGVTMQDLSLTLGSDKRVVVKREKMQDFSSTKLIGSDRKQVFTYQLTVRNAKNTAISMTLKDQYPTSTQKDIEVELLDDGAATINKEIGVLIWSFDLKAGETRTFKFSYSVKYPKDKILNL